MGSSTFAPETVSPLSFAPSSAVDWAIAYRVNAGEDDVRRGEKSLDELTHKHVEHIDEILKHKEAELLEV